VDIDLHGQVPILHVAWHGRSSCPPPHALQFVSTDAQNPLGLQVLQGDWAVPKVFCEFLYLVLRFHAVF
jgi:hypothetical protein